jgi:hypothetical protein
VGGDGHTHHWASIDKRMKPQRILFWCLLCLQWLVLLVIAFGDIGFDLPGRYGLDFDALLILLTLYGICAIALIYLAVLLRKMWCATLVLLNIALPILCFLSILYIETRPDPAQTPHAQEVGR